MIIVDEIVSVDGYAARRDGTIDFFTEIDGLVDSVGNAEGMTKVAAVLLGAATYLQFAEYWPAQDPTLPVNALPKHVVSTRLDAAPWGTMPPASLERAAAATPPPDIARRLDAAYEGDIVVWGSLSIARALLDAGAVDEVWLRIVPAVLGEGRTFMPKQTGRWTLLETERQPGGWATARYALGRTDRGS